MPKNRITEARKSVGMTQRQLGERLGVSRACIGGYESGQFDPGLHRIFGLIEALGVPFEYLWPVSFRWEQDDTHREEVASL